MDLDFCMYGEPYRKATRIFSDVKQMEGLSRVCCHRKHTTVLRGSEMVMVDGVRKSVPKTVRAGQYPLALTAAWAQIIAPSLSGSSNQSVVLDLQWKHELERRLKKSVSKGQIHTTDQWDFQLSNLDSKFKGVKENIIFGQHSNKEAQARQEKLRKILGGRQGQKQRRLFNQEETSTAPADESLESQRSDTAQASRCGTTV